MNIGDIIGERVVLDLWHDPKTYRKMAKTLCSCGNEQTMRVSNLVQADRCTKCSSGRPRIYTVIPGTKYGKRTIIAEDGHLGLHRAALTRCDCGGVDRVAVHQLRNAHTDGCWRCGSKQVRPEIILGERFGNRVVTAEAPDQNGKQAVYMTCDCGDVSVVKYAVAKKHKVCKTCADNDLRARNQARRRFKREDILGLLNQGLTIKQVADQLGCSKGYVSDVKRGRK